MTDATPRDTYRRFTRYEVAAIPPEGSDRSPIVVGFTMHKSRPGLLKVAQRRGEELADAMALDDSHAVNFETRPRPAMVFSNGWRVTFTGRTEREARLLLHATEATP